jgi:hypothetical protein
MHILKHSAYGILNIKYYYALVYVNYVFRVDMTHSFEYVIIQFNSFSPCVPLSAFKLHNFALYMR